MNYRIHMICVCIAIFVVPAFAQAIMISEINYDPPATDTGQEWIEIYNNQSSPVDLTGWKFFENNVNHGIAAYTGSLVLPAGAYAVIADQPAQVASVYPNIEYLYDSAFSLHNTGETLVMKNSDLEIIDTVTYTAPSSGSGNGGTLNAIGGSWVLRNPSPGQPPSSSAPVVSDDEDEEGGNPGDGTDSAHEGDPSDGNPTQTASDTARKKEEQKEPLYTLSLVVDAIAVAHDPVTFEGIFLKDGTRLQSGRFEWNVGDGTYFTTRKLTKFTHTYQAPGTYVVVLEYYRTVFDDVPFLRVTKTLEVLAGSVRITAIENTGLITFENTDTKDIDLAGWKLVSGTSMFTFKANTIIKSEKTLAIPFVVHQLPVSPNSSATLLKPDGMIAARFPNSSNVSYERTTDTVEHGEEELGIDQERARIVASSQEARVPVTPLAGRFVWILAALGGVIVLASAALVFVVRKGVVVLDNQGTSETPKKPVSFDDIQLLS